MQTRVCWECIQSVLMENTYMSQVELNHFSDTWSIITMWKQHEMHCSKIHYKTVTMYMYIILVNNCSVLCLTQSDDDGRGWRGHQRQLSESSSRIFSTDNIQGVVPTASAEASRSVQLVWRILWNLNVIGFDFLICYYHSYIFQSYEWKWSLW